MQTFLLLAAALLLLLGAAYSTPGSAGCGADDHCNRDDTYYENYCNSSQPLSDVTMCNGECGMAVMWQ